MTKVLLPDSGMIVDKDGTITADDNEEGIVTSWRILTAMIKRIRAAARVPNAFAFRLLLLLLCPATAAEFVATAFRTDATSLFRSRRSKSFMAMETVAFN